MDFITHSKNYHSAVLRNVYKKFLYFQIHFSSCLFLSHYSSYMFTRTFYNNYIVLSSHYFLPLLLLSPDSDKKQRLFKVEEFIQFKERIT